MRILVTGATGFIGSALCARLSREGAELHVLARSPRPAAFSGAGWWQADVVDSAAVSRAVAGAAPHAIFHLASAATGASSRAPLQEMIEVHVLGTANVLDAAARLRRLPEVVLVGSMVEPGPGGQTVPASPYAVAKGAARLVADYFDAIHELRLVRVRLFMVYGGGQADLTKLVPYLIMSSLRGIQPELGRGSLPLDWTYVDDVVDGLIAALVATPRERVDLGTGRLTTVRELATLIGDLTGAPTHPAFGAIDDRPAVHPIRADVSTTAAAIGWQAATPLEEGLRRTIEWYRKLPYGRTGGDNPSCARP